MTVMVFEACIKMWNCHHLDAVIKCVLAWSLYYTVMNITKCKPGAVLQCDPRAPGSWLLGGSPCPGPVMRRSVASLTALAPRPDPPRPALRDVVSRKSVFGPQYFFSGCPSGPQCNCCPESARSPLVCQQFAFRIGTTQTSLSWHSPATATHPHTRIGWSLLAWI